MGNKQHKPIVEAVEALQLIPLHQQAELRTEFARMAHQEKVEKDVFIAYLEPIFSPFRGPVLERIFQVFDLNANGSIDFSEFVSCYFMLRFAHREQRLRLVFNLFDVEGNGKINKKHFRSIAIALMMGSSSFAPGAQKVITKELTALVDVYVNSTYNIFNRGRDGNLTWGEWKKFADDDTEVNKLIECLERSSHVPLSALITPQLDHR